MANEAGTEAVHTPPTPLKALGMLAGAAAMTAGYIVLCTFLGNQELYGGFLFLLCWAAFEQCSFTKLPRAVLGAMLGIAMGYLLKLMLASSLGFAGGLIFGVIALAVVYVQMLQRLSILINFTTMTFLLVTTMAEVQQYADFSKIVIAFVAGVAYFCAIIGIAGKLATKKTAAAAIEA